MLKDAAIKGACARRAIRNRKLLAACTFFELKLSRPWLRAVEFRVADEDSSVASVLSRS